MNPPKFFHVIEANFEIAHSCSVIGESFEFGGSEGIQISFKIDATFFMKALFLLLILMNAE